MMLRGRNEPVEVGLGHLGHGVPLRSLKIVSGALPPIGRARRTLNRHSTAPKILIAPLLLHAQNALSAPNVQTVPLIADR